MALITCPECGKEISAQAKACPHCGYPLSQAPTGPSVGQADTVAHKQIMGKLIALLVVLTVLIGGVVWYTNALHGDDTAAYNIMLKCAPSFKDPSSVRILSGMLSDDKTCLWVRVSAKNSFGANITGSFWLEGEKGWILEETEGKNTYLYNATDKLNYVKLTRRWIITGNSGACYGLGIMYALKFL